MLEVSNAVIALIGLILALIVALGTAFAYVTARINTVGEDAATQRNRQREVIEANLTTLREVMQAKIDGLAERESKQRHDLRNELQMLLGKQDTEITTAQRNVDAMLRDALRRADLENTRVEIMQAITALRQETQQNLQRAEEARARTNERLAERIDAMTVRVARLSGPDDATLR